MNASLRRLRKRRTALVVACVLLLGAFAGGCLAAKLENGFDLKGPKGLAGYIGNLIQSSGCAFDSGTFDSCSFGP